MDRSDIVAFLRAMQSIAAGHANAQSRVRQRHSSAVLRKPHVMIRDLPVSLVVEAFALDLYPAEGARDDEAEVPDLRVPVAGQ